MSDDDDTFKPIANINKKIAIDLGLPLPETNEEIIEYDQPKEYGLSNCNVIIPVYYGLHKSPEKFLNIDYFTMIKDDIRNLRPLHQYQMNYIKSLSHEEKYELIEIFTPLDI